MAVPKKLQNLKDKLTKYLNYKYIPEHKDQLDTIVSDKEFVSGLKGRDCDDYAARAVRYVNKNSTYKLFMLGCKSPSDDHMIAYMTIKADDGKYYTLIVNDHEVTIYKKKALISVKLELIRFGHMNKNEKVTFFKFNDTGRGKILSNETFEYETRKDDYSKYLTKITKL